MDFNMGISPDDIEQGGRMLDLLIQGGKWVGGTAVAAWVAVRFTVNASVAAGEKMRKYEELVEDFNALKVEKEQWLTKREHADIQRLCQGEIEKMIDQRLHRAILEWKDELASLNANICHIMGALKLQPVDQGKRRRRADREDGD